MHPVLKKMNAEEEGLSVNQRMDLILSDAGTVHAMGPDQTATISIDYNEIKNEL